MVHGPHTFNFLDVYRELDAVGGARPVTEAASLAEAVALLIDDPAARARQIAEAAALVDRCTGALDRTMIALDELLETTRRG